MKKPSASSNPQPRRNENLGLPPAPHRDWQHDWWLLFVPATIASAAWWFLIAQLLRGPSRSDASGYALVLVVALVAFVMIGCTNGIALLSAYLVRSWRWQGVMSLVIALPVLGFLHFTWWIVGAMLVFAIGIWVAMVTTTHDVRSRLHVRPWASLAAGSSAIALGTITAVALIIGNQVIGVNQTPQQRVNRLLDGATQVIEQGLQTSVPDILPTMTIDQAIAIKLPSAQTLLQQVGITDTLSSGQEQQLTKMLRDSYGIDRSFEAGQTKNQLTKDLQQVIHQYQTQSIDEIRKQISDRVGISLSGTLTVHQAIRSALAHHIEDPAMRFASFFGVVAAAVAWFLLRVLSPFLTWAAVLCGTSWYWILRKIGFIQVAQRVEEVEHLDWQGN